MRSCLILAISVVLGIVTPAKAGGPLSLSIKEGQLEVQAEISQRVRVVPGGAFKISAKITVTNHGEKPIPFSTKLLYLGEPGTIKARAYLDTVASNVIDFSAVPIKPKEPRSFHVYWLLYGPNAPRPELVTIEFLRELPTLDPLSNP